MALAGAWVTQAACRGVVSGPDTDVFFAPEELPGASRSELARQARAREVQAKRICCACPVIQECLAFALVTGQPEGVWGGLSARERARLRHPQPTPVAHRAGR